jgi:ketosteroid isomerase-like protein
MNKIMLLIILLGSSMVLKAQHILTKDQQKVQETVVNFFEALSNRDSIALKKYATSDIVLYEYGSIWNADTLIRKAIKLNTATDFNRINNFDFISTTVHKNTAWTSYYLFSEIMKDGKKSTVQWMETVIVLKKKKIWKIKVLHSTLIKRN